MFSVLCDEVDSRNGLTRPPAHGRAPLTTRFAPAFRYNLPGLDTTSARGCVLTRALPPVQRSSTSIPVTSSNQLTIPGYDYRGIQNTAGCTDKQTQNIATTIKEGKTLGFAS